MNAKQYVIVVERHPCCTSEAIIFFFSVHFVLTFSNNFISLQRDLNPRPTAYEAVALPG